MTDRRIDENGGVDGDGSRGTQERENRVLASEGITANGHPEADCGSLVGTKEAPHRIVLAVLRRNKKRTIYSVAFRGQHLLDHWEPELNACRLLHARGFSGVLRVRWAGADHDATEHDIERSSMIAVVESDALGPVARKYRAFGGSPASDDSEGGAS